MVKEIDILNTYVLHLGLDDDNVDRRRVRARDIAKIHRDSRERKVTRV